MSPASSPTWRYTQLREELLQAAVPGIDPARRLACLTDEMLVELAEGPAADKHPHRVRWSLVALGGYGAGALLPASDLDLLVVSDASPTGLKPFVEALLYPLWDAGLSVGHQVRSRREQLVAVRNDLETLTATLTGRVIAGDEALGTRVLRECTADAGRRAASVLGAIRARPRPGSPYLLEPDLKEGAGGRRDFDELTWTAAVLTASPQSDPSALVSLGVLEAGELAALEVAADTVAAARWQLQRGCGGTTTNGGGNCGAAASLMTEDAAAGLRTDPAAVQHALADTHHVLMRTRRRITGGRTTRNGRAAGGRTGDDGEVGSGGRAPLAAAGVLDLLGRGPDALPELEEAVWAGQLEHLVPGIRELMWLRRPGIAHTLTVGAHSLACAAQVGRLLAGGHRVADRDALLVAALVHDIGKIEPGPGHAERGTTPARLVALRFGLTAARADTVADLVRQHLFLPETASRIDLDDPIAIASAAQSLGDRELLAPLHALTIADSLATGPGAWSEWHGALVSELRRALEVEFARDGSVFEMSGAGAANGAGSGATAPFDPRLDALAARVAGDPTPGAHRLEIGTGPIPGSFTVTIAAHDRPGLLATFSGTFALAGLDILGASSTAPRNGVALDTFVVCSATLATVGPETWNRVERTLTAALAGRFAIAVRLGERRRHYTTRVEGTLSSRIEEDGRGATLHVRAPDRVGLLHDIARAIAESGLDVYSLTATSRAGWAEDTFRLALAEETGAGALGQLSMRLREL